MSKRFAENITPDELKSLEMRSFSGRIIVVDNHERFRNAIRHLHGIPLLGFDTETKPSFRKGRKNKVSLIQLADHHTAYLFRLNHIGLPDSLVNILSDPSVVKTGVALHDDLRVIKNIRHFEPSGFIDLQSFVRNYGIQSSGLRKITAIVLGFRISKSQQVTDWEAPELSEAQKIYAATDAWVCYEIYKKLLNHEGPL